MQILLLAQEAPRNLKRYIKIIASKNLCKTLVANNYTGYGKHTDVDVTLCYLPMSLSQTDPFQTKF